MTTIRGVYTAIATPFTADSTAIDLDRLDAAIARQAAGGVTGVVPCGTTGESPTLSGAEHRAVVERTVEAARRHGLQVVAGAGSNSTRHALELHRLAADLGADAALHVCPYYNKPSAEGLYRHFSTIAESCALPIVLYNIPGRTGVTLTAATIERLARNARIVAVKDATGALATAEDVLARTDLAVLSGDDPLTLPLIALGGHGVISVLSNVLPAEVVALVNAALDGDFQTARTIHHRLLPFARALLSLDSNPVPLKAALRAAGHDTGAVRLPLVAATSAVEATITGLLAELAPAASAT